jgi:hypothetical protein
VLLIFYCKLYIKYLSKVKDNIVTNMGDTLLLPVEVREGDARSVCYIGCVYVQTVNCDDVFSA